MEKELNQAENRLIVGSIKVLGEVDGPGFTKIRQGIKNVTQDLTTLNNEVQRVTLEQNDYWSSIGSDLIITPIEKKTLRKEWETIEQSHSTLMNLAEEKGIEQTSNFQKYDEYYQNLHDYLFVTIKLFDDMSDNTTIPSYNAFKLVYDNYYDMQLKCQAILSEMTGKFTVRNLSTLEEEGTEGEVAMFHLQFYRYSGGIWQYLGTGEYMGALDDFPEEDILNNFFLAAKDITANVILKVNGRGLLVNNKILSVTHVHKAGYLYTYTEDGWKQIIDREDYRYMTAINDLMKYDFELPHSYTTWFYEQVDKEIAENAPPAAHYIGPLTAAPSNANEGDWYYNTTTDKLYKLTNPGAENPWLEINASDTRYREEFMAALTDILTYHKAADGYFNTVFAQSLFANQATLNALSVETLILREGNENKKGAIQSDNWEQGKTGFKLNHDGSAEFNGSCEIGDKAIFRGDIVSGPLELTSKTPTPYVDIYPKGYRFYEKYATYVTGAELPEESNTLKKYMVDITYGENNAYKIEFIHEIEWTIEIGVDSPLYNTRFRIKMNLYNISNEIIYTENGTWSEWSGKLPIPMLYGTSELIITNELKIRTLDQGSKTMKIKNLPIGLITEKNTIFLEPIAEGSDIYNLRIRI